MSKRRVAIVGVGRTYHRTKRPDVNIPELSYEAAKAALDDANLEFKDIDAIVMGNMEFFENRSMTEMWQMDHIGGYLKSGVHVATGGTVGATVASTAFEYAASGLFNTVLAVGFEKQSEADSRAAIRLTGDPCDGRSLMRAAVGILAMFAFDYMQRTGCKEEHAAMVRLRADKNACRNPWAHLKLGLQSIDQIIASPYMLTPLRYLDMCPTSEGAAAIIVAPEEKARKIAKKPVWVVDWESAHNSGLQTKFGAPLVSTASLAEAVGRLFKRNGITNPRKQISVAELYTPSTYGELLWIESYGLCGEGEAWKLEEKGEFNMEGPFPVNPSGGVLATNAIASTGVLRPLEAALQLREDAGEHQITRKPHLALSTGWGGLSWTVAHLLSNRLDLD